MAGGHGRAGGKRNQGKGGGSADGKRAVLPVMGQKSRQLGLPELGSYGKKMERQIKKQNKRSFGANKRVRDNAGDAVNAGEAAAPDADEDAEDDGGSMQVDEPAQPAADNNGQKRGQFAAMMLHASASRNQFEAKQELMSVRAADFDFQLNRSKENSKKRFWKEFQKVVKVSDVLLEVLDARDPLGCRLSDIERSIDTQFEGRKKFVLVLNKVDLVPKENIEKWMEYFRVEGLPVVAFSAAKGGLAAAHETSNTKDREDPTHRCVHQLLETCKKFQKTEGGGRRRITVGIVGFPNVGKSSVINALKRERVVGTGNTPGVTTTAQEISLQGHIKVVDCPGVVISDSTTAETALRSAAKIEHLADVIGPCEIIYDRCGSDRLCELYHIPKSNREFDEIISALAEKKGKLLRGGKPDIEGACKIVLKDWNDGHIPYYTVPPTDRDFMLSGQDTQVNTYATLHTPSLPEQDLPGSYHFRRVYSSVVEHSAAVRTVPGSNPGGPSFLLCSSEFYHLLLSRLLFPFKSSTTHRITADEQVNETTILDKLTARGQDFICLGAGKKQEISYKVDEEPKLGVKRKRGPSDMDGGVSAFRGDEGKTADADGDGYDPFKQFMDEVDEAVLDMEGGFVGEGEAAEDVMRDDAELAQEEEGAEEGERKPASRVVAARARKMLKSQGRKMLRIKRQG